MFFGNLTLHLWPKFDQTHKALPAKIVEQPQEL